ncbi:hypothetical protein CCAX7_52730 [Capsulimonas corticalis]|uniref:Uncharacterized protein n=2 Tax=Capsulimonas corticalis TaxID=2219043 RepID=A0A402CP19_9BACT|nr:hypothetical protein CCAX7_52730 [Capsulimonas corticalis]
MDFDVHNDAANLASASKILNVICFVFVLIGVPATFCWLGVIAPFVAFPVLIVSKSRVAKELAISALLAIIGDFIIFSAFGGK